MPAMKTNSSKFHANLFIQPIDMHANQAFNYFIDFNVIAECLSLKLLRYVRSSLGPRVSDELRINFHEMIIARIIH